MEMALYYPELGYYASPKEKIGKDGDYYTSPLFSSLFGEMIAEQLEEMWNCLGKKEFTIVEYGAGTGVLCNDILHQLQNKKGLFERLQYCIIEKSEAMREKESQLLSSNGKVRWLQSIGEIDLSAACILSNEVLDNFAVHEVVMMDELMEVFIDYEDGFTEFLLPASPQLKEYLQELGVVLPYSFSTEINLAAIEWLKEISAALRKGFVLTVDYGFSSAEFYSARHRLGTLICYNDHSVSDSPFMQIGEQDITSHVNFSALAHWGRRNGLENCGFTDQRHFLLSLGLADHLRKKERDGKPLDTDELKKVSLIHTLLTDMGSKLKVLIQQKGLNHPQLSGLKFCSRLD